MARHPLLPRVDTSASPVSKFKVRSLTLPTHPRWVQRKSLVAVKLSIQSSFSATVVPPYVLIDPAHIRGKRGFEFFECWPHERTFGVALAPKSPTELVCSRDRPTIAYCGPMITSPAPLSTEYMIERRSWPRRVFGGCPSVDAELLFRMLRRAAKRIAAPACPRLLILPCFAFARTFGNELFVRTRTTIMVLCTLVH